MRDSGVLRFQFQPSAARACESVGDAFAEVLDPPPGADLEQFVRDTAWGHHASCTCRIGADGDPMAVLDHEFRVRGAKNLRVVDASVFPRIPGLFILTSVYMISEKASDVIVDQYR